MNQNFDYRYLKPAELCTADHPTLVSTVLGSCVSLVLHAPQRGLSSICHALLPSGTCPNSSYRFVDCSIRHMVEQMRQRGLRADQLEAKLFGGSDMFSFQSTVGGRGSVGNQNIIMARTLIEEQGLNLVACDVGGGRGRKLLLYSHTGDVFIKLLGARSTEAGRKDPDALLEAVKRPQRHAVRGEL